MNIKIHQNFFYFINFIIFSTLSINIFKSGLPQHYHYLFLFNLLIFFNYKFSDILKSIFNIKYLLIFMIFIILYGFFRYYFSNNIDYFFNVRFYIYNFFIIVSLYLLLLKFKNLFKYIVLGSICGIFINLLLIFYIVEINSFLYLNHYAEIYNRLDLLSKTKNTFGFYILFVNVLFFIYFDIYYKHIYHIYIKYFLFLTSLTILFTTVAIASILGFIVLISLSLFNDIFYRNRINFIIIPIFLFISLLFFLFLFMFFPAHIENFFSIMNNLGSNKDETFVGRGYDIVLYYPQYLLLGVGDISVVKYFNWDIEIHSLFVHVFFSYGLVGTILFIFIFFEIFYQNILLCLIVISTFLVYYLSHNPIISSIFWMTLMFLNFAKIVNNNDQN